MSRSKGLVLVLTCFAFILAISSVFAGESATTAQPSTTATSTAAQPASADQQAQDIPRGPLDMIAESGYIGYLICFLSVITLALIIENTITIKREKLMPEDLLADIEAALDEGNYEEAMDLCQSEDCMMTRIIGAGLSKMSLGVERMEDAISEESDAQATMLHQKLGYINMIAGVAPMLGLLGTVSGMITAFGIMASNPQANASVLAAGIYVALMTTLLGLVVAIPATVAFTFFRGRVVKILIVMGIVNGEIIDRFRAAEEEYYEEE